jgi:hypothetical protein
MSTADAARPDVSPEDGSAQRRPLRAAPSSPLPSASWLLRTGAFVAGTAGILGVIVAPGIRGNASEGVVVAMERLSGAFAFFLLLVLIALAVWGALELLRAHDVIVPARVALIGGAAVVVAMSSPGLRDRVPTGFAVLIAAAAAIAALAGAYASALRPHTRAAAGVLFVFAFAAIARLGAWELAMRAGDTASVRMFAIGRGLATAGVLFEAGGQLLAVTWLGTRSRGAGQLGSSLALVGAFVLTWGVARGVHSGAALWQAVLHTALADAPGVPPLLFGLDALATFLVPASLLLALVTAAQPGQVVAMLATMALALVSRGAFDAPLRALCAVVAAQWAVLAGADQHAMWRTLIAERSARLAEEADGADGTVNAGKKP